ncbi:MAG: hypothetical protein KA538_06415 [Azonexus sp.]|jgi:hypothetical protein|nr:hypothetical protein [Azonexus sp.]
MEKDQDSSSSGKIGRDRPRGPDRRVSTRIGPPPYQTNEGAVLVDRRSQIDRRATWIREFSLGDES